MYCYWYMPFDSGARIVIKNEGSKDYNLDISISSVKLESADNLLRFHAKWSRGGYAEDKNRWPDYSILNTEGRGRFVGVSLHAYKSRSGVDPKSAEGGAWWGEGDEKFFVDGEKFPSWFGTGTEDYFGYAWCNPTVFNEAFHSQPYNKGGVNGIGNRMVNRFHIIDNIPFMESFDGYLEKYYGDSYIKYGITSYWYLAPEGNDKYETVSLEKRTDYFEIPYKGEPKNYNEAEALEIISCTGGTASGQDMKGFGSGWSDEQQVWWSGGKKGDKLELELPAAADGKYNVEVNMTKAVDYGMVQIYINGEKIGDQIDLYSTKVEPTRAVELGIAELKQGFGNRITIEITGKNPKATNYMFGLDYINLIPVQ